MSGWSNPPFPTPPGSNTYEIPLKTETGIKRCHQRAPTKGPLPQQSPPLSLANRVVSGIEVSIPNQYFSLVSSSIPRLVFYRYWAALLHSPVSENVAAPLSARPCSPRQHREKEAVSPSPCAASTNRARGAEEAESLATNEEWRLLYRCRQKQLIAGTCLCPSAAIRGN